MKLIKLVLQLSKAKLMSALACSEFVASLLRHKLVVNQHPVQMLQLSNFLSVNARDNSSCEMPDR